MADLYMGKSSRSQEKVGRVDNSGDVYAGRSSRSEEKVGRVDSVPRRAGAAAIPLLLR